MAFGARGRKRFSSKAVAQHLRQHLGKPFAVLREEATEGVEISIYGFAEVPVEGQVTVATEGVSTYFRENGLAGPDGYAQELLMVIDKIYFGEEMLNFFMAVVGVYLAGGSQLDWTEPVRLSSGIPAGKHQRLLLPMPAGVFEEEFSFVKDGPAETNFVMLVPVYENEVDYLIENGALKLYDQFEEQDVDVSNLGRPALTLPSV